LVVSAGNGYGVSRANVGNGFIGKAIVDLSDGSEIIITARL
jgi:hypothetical protein